MGRYHVHLYPIVRLLVRDVEAASQVEAIKKAEKLVDLHRLFCFQPDPGIATMEYAEGIDGFLVDEDGDNEYGQSTCYDIEYEPI